MCSRFKPYKPTGYKVSKNTTVLRDTNFICYFQNVTAVAAVSVDIVDQIDNMEQFTCVSYVFTFMYEDVFVGSV